MCNIKPLLLLPVLLAALFVMPHSALAEAATFPPEVTDHIDDMERFCRESGGNPVLATTASSSNPLVEHGVLSKSGIEIWAIDEGRFDCDGAAGLFSGSWGGQVNIFAREAGGPTKLVFSHGAWSLSMERSGSFVTPWLRVAGKICGSQEVTSRADAVSCERSLIWDSSAKKLDFAPLREARFGQ